jgi:hypothetical protein
MRWEAIGVAIQIVEDVPGGRSAWRRLVRFLAVLVGFLLTCIGLLASAFPLLTIVAALLLLVQGEMSEADWGNDWLPFVITTIVAIVGIWAGLRLIRGRRGLGLYLRKFGFADTTRTVSRALRSAVGRTTRLVTLDDSATAPVGVGSGRGWARLVLVLAVAVIALLIYEFNAGAFDVDAQDFIDQAQAQSGDGAGDRIGAAAAGTIGYVVGEVVVLLMLLMLGSVVAAVALFMMRASRRATVAQRNATRALAHEGQVGPAARHLAKAARYVFSPRLMVVTVPTAFWQKAISGFMDVVDVVIVDVSQPTDALLWEINTLKSRLNRRFILVGQHDMVASLAAPGTAALGTPGGLLARMLDGETILAYRPSDPDRFARALRNRLASLS